ncbi:MAG: hypothetical protein ACFE8P_13935, partial [Promethearchaeota archaeon]
KKETCFYIEKAGSLFTMLNSLVFLHLLVIFFLNSVQFTAYIVLVNIYTIFFLIYYGIRILSKLWIKFRLEGDKKILPGVLPAYFMIFKCTIGDRKISSLIERKSLFIKGTKTIVSHSTNLGKNEMDLFKKGIAWCNEKYYFAKWTKYPKFIDNQNNFIFRIYFLETMMRGATTFVQFTFDTINHKLVNVKRAYGRF